MSRARRLGLAIGAVVVIIVVAAAVLLAPLWTGPALPEGATRLHITTDSGPRFACMAALLAPVRIASSNEELILVSVASGEPVPVVWPSGFAAWRIDGRAELADPYGTIVGRERDVLDHLGGGSGSDDVFHVCGLGFVGATLHRHDDEVLAFDYPAGWGEATFDVVSSFSSVLVYLSTAPLSDPCDRTPGSIACVRSAVSALGPDGVLVEWSRRSWPGWTFDPTRGRLMQIGGRNASLDDVSATEGGCQTIGGERELVVTVDDPVADQNWTEMRACLRGPNLDLLKAQVETMLASVTWKH